MTTDTPEASALRERVVATLTAELGDSYDCQRVWSAWDVGTMDEGDFVPVTERIDDIANAILALTRAPVQQSGEAVDGSLKPCPFCGGAAVLTGHRAPEFSVHCLAIGCKASTEAFGSKGRAIAVWNTRVPVQQSEDTVAFVQKWLMNADYNPSQFDRDFAAAIDARCAALTLPQSADAGVVEALIRASDIPHYAADDISHLEGLAGYLDGYARDKGRARLPESRKLFETIAKRLREYDAIRVATLDRLTAAQGEGLVDSPRYTSGVDDSEKGVGYTQAAYVTVPREPTEAMVVAGDTASWDHGNHMPAIHASRAIWSAMLAAAAPQDHIAGDGGVVLDAGEARTVIHALSFLNGRSGPEDRLLRRLSAAPSTIHGSAGV